jgi:hypothetical protein
VSEGDLLDIANRDVEEMYAVCDSIMNKNTIYGMEREDLRQILIVRAIFVFKKYWKEDRIKFKNSKHRLNNIHIFTRYNLQRYISNIYAYLGADKRKANIFPQSFELLELNNDNQMHDFDLNWNLDLSVLELDEKEMKFISYLIERTEKPETIFSKTKLKESDISEGEIDEIVYSLKNNDELYQYLKN